MQISPRELPYAFLYKQILYTFIDYATFYILCVELSNELYIEVSQLFSKALNSSYSMSELFYEKQLLFEGGGGQCRDLGYRRRYKIFHPKFVLITNFDMLKVATEYYGCFLF